MSERSERFRAAAKRRRDAGFIDGSTDGEGLCDDIEELEAKLDRINEARELAAARYADWSIPTTPILGDLLMVLDVELSG